MSGQEEKIEKSESLDERAVLAKDSESETRALFDEFMPFLRSRVARYSAQYSEHQREDMLSAVMMAFYEAIKGYDSAKGHFFPYADRVVCSRAIDYIRKLKRELTGAVSLDDDDEENRFRQAEAINELSLRGHRVEQRRMLLAEEIEQFKAEIAFWGITMEMLVKASPKQSQQRETYSMIVSTVLNNQEIMQTIQLKRYFPVKSIHKATGLPLKKVERARIFVLASLTISIGDYDLLSDFIAEGGRGQG